MFLVFRLASWNLKFLLPLQCIKHKENVTLNRIDENCAERETNLAFEVKKKKRLFYYLVNLSPQKGLPPNNNPQCDTLLLETKGLLFKGLMNWLFHCSCDTFGQILEHEHFCHNSWASLRPTEFTTEQLVLIHFQVPYLDAELTSCALGSVSAQPIKNTIIHFQDHFALIEHAFSTDFFSPDFFKDGCLPHDSDKEGESNSCCCHRGKRSDFPN